MVRLEPLERDYAAMAGMIVGAVPPFDEVMSIVSALEVRLNEHEWVTSAERRRVTPDGTVLDPTKEQFASQGQGVYEPREGPEPTGTCLNCGALVYGETPFCNSNCTNEFSSYIESEIE